jgi:hypothetical protein
MNDPVRLCDGDDDAAKRMMLAMRDERSPAGAAQRALVALGAVGASVTAGGAAAGAGVGAGKSAWLVLIKWLGGGAALGLAVGGGASLISPPKAPPGQSPAVVTTEPLETPAKIEAQATREPEQPETQTPPASTARTAPIAPVDPPPGLDPGAAPTASFAAPQADTLAREVELLDQARQALGRGDGTLALGTLDRFAREFPRGRLSAEAFVVRLQALMRAGRAAEARTLAEQHLRARPSSPHAQRIREITGLGATP